MNAMSLGYGTTVAGVIVGLALLVAGEAMEGAQLFGVLEGLDGFVLIGGLIILVAVSGMTALLAAEDGPETPEH